MPELKKGALNETSHSIAIDDRLVRWCGWPEGPYGKVGQSVLNNKGKPIVRKDKSEVTYVSAEAPLITITQRTIKTGYEPDGEAPSLENGGLERTLVLEWVQ